MNQKWMDFIKYKAIVWKIPLAAALSWEIAEWAGSQHPYLAPLTVILSIQLTVDKSIQFAWQRITGTIAGVLFTVWIAPIVGTSGWSIGLLLLVGALLVTWLKLDHAILVQVALSILLVMYFQNKMPSYPMDRVRDTLIGAVVAMVIHLLVFPPDSIHKARKKMVHFSDHLSHQFTNTALWIKEGCPPHKAQALQNQLQSLFQELHQTTTELDQADKSLKYNPLGARKRMILNQLTRHMERLRSGYANLSDMLRVLTKWSESGHFAIDHQRIWSEHLLELSSHIKHWKKGLEEPEAVNTISKASTQLIQAPAHLKNEQYPLALYMNAEQVIQDFQSSSKFL